MSTEIDWLIGLSVMFSLAMLMTVSSTKRIEGFFVWLTIFAGFVVWSGLIDLWILILLMIVLVILFFSNISKKGSVI